MTETPVVNPLAIVAGAPGYITISNIRTAPTATGFTVTFDTDQACLIQMDYWAHQVTSFVPAIVSETPAKTQHTFTTGAIAGSRPGMTFGFSLRLDANDVSGKTLRSQQGFVQLLGSRSVARLNAVPVRFNQYGDGTRPAGGGGIGNWSSYTWAQYNPKNTTYPTP